MNKLREFLGDNFNFVIKLLIGLFVLYWFFYFLTPKTTMSDEDKKKMDFLIQKIEELNKKQKLIDSSVFLFDQNLKNISDSISEVKNNKIIIREIYHEKINRIRQFNDVQLDSFFTARYGNSSR